MAGRFTVEAVFKTIDRVTAPIGRMTNRVNRSMRSIRTSVRKVSGAFKKMARTLGPVLGAAGVAGALIAVKMAIGDVMAKGADFEQSLVSAGVRFEEPIRRGTEAFGELSAAARLAGRTTEFTSTESANALKFMAKAGFDAQFAIGALPMLIDLATASEQDLARASDIVSDSMAAFGLVTGDATKDMENLTRVSDQMVKATNSSNLTFEDLFETIKLGAPLATAAGVSMDELIAITARMAASGIKGSRGGTVLQAMFTKLVDPKVQKSLKRLGTTVLDADKNMRPFSAILDDIGASMRKLTPAQQAGVMSDIFEIRGGRGVLTFLTQGSEGLKDLQEKLQNVQGETQKMATVMRDTTQGAMKEFWSSVESIELSLFEAQGGTEDFFRSLTTLTRGVNDFVNEEPEIVKMTTAFAGISAIALAVGVVIAAVAAAVAFIIGSPVALAGAVLALAAGLAAYAQQSGKLADFKQQFKDIGGRVGQAFSDKAAGLRKGLVHHGALDPLPAEGTGPEVSDGERRRIIENVMSLTIRDETGRASMDGEFKIPGFNLRLIQTGDLG
jgi:TP901 family phage tail tape measure protein